MLLKVGTILRSFVRILSLMQMLLTKIYGMPPKVIFAVPIDTSFKVVCYTHSKLTMVWHLLNFTGKLETYSHLNYIFKYMKKAATRFKCWVIFSEYCWFRSSWIRENNKQNFFWVQMVLKTFKKFGGFYPPNTLWEVINLYFRG